MINRLLEPTTNIRHHASDLKTVARSLANDLHNEATNKFGPLKEMAQDHLSDMHGRASDSFQLAKGLVRKHPRAALGIGVVAGLFLAAWALRPNKPTSA
jgi:ElaB/YqjD/DUF883 family membrane-anchored ribosome-binding protein